jgi:hypothetical protein
MKRQFVLGLLIFACALPVAGCGSGSATGEGAAGIVPAEVPVYVSIDTDFEGDQIQQARALLARFPGSAGLLRMLEAELEQGGDVDFQRDVRPALGTRLDFVLLDIPEPGSDPAVVVLLQPADEAKLDALLAKAPADSRPVKAEIEGWTVLAQNQSVIDRFEQKRGGETLGDSDAFKDAMDGLAEDALVRAYVDPRAVTQSAFEQDPALRQLEGLFQVDAVGAVATAEEQGFRLEGVAKTEQGSETFEPELPSAFPSGAIAYLGLGNIAEPARQALNRAGEQNPELDRQIAQLELALGLSLDEDILPLFEQESAIAVYPGAAGAEVPSIVVALRVDDEQAAVATLDRILERAAQFEPDISAPSPTQVDGLDAKEVTVSGVTIFYAGFDGKVVATNDRTLLAATNADGDKLSGDATYERARELAEVPGELESLLYVNLNEGAALAFDLAERSGETVPPQVHENVEPLDSFIAYSTREDGRSRAAGFLALAE